MEQASERFSRRSEKDQREAERRDFIRLVSYTIQTQRFAADVCGKLFSLSKQMTDDAKRLIPPNAFDSAQVSESTHWVGALSETPNPRDDVQHQLDVLSRQMEELMKLLRAK